MNHDKYIIDTPELQSLKLKYSSALLTLIFWIIWFYLWLPVITLLGWWFQIDVFRHTMITEKGLESFLDKLPVLAGYASLLIASLVVWSGYNYIKFRRIQRRKAIPPVTRTDILEKFNFDEQSLNELQEGKIVTVHFNENGAVELIKVDY